MKKFKSLGNYIHGVGGFIDRNSPIVEEPVVVKEERPVLTVVKNEKIVENVVEVESTPLVEAMIQPEASEPEIVTESINNNIVEYLQESINDLRTALQEQQNTQVQLGKLIGKLFESVKNHDANVDQRFEHVNHTLNQTSSMLVETTEKLQQLSVREITVPAPIVNLSITEQKRIIKTVDRDENGLIRQITEEIEQSVSADK
jgi:seryl-tRNA synthetase